MYSVDQLNDILQDDRFFKLIEECSIYFNPASRLDDHDTLTVDSDVEKVIIQKFSFHLIIYRMKGNFFYTKVFM